MRIKWVAGLLALFILGLGIGFSADRIHKAIQTDTTPTSEVKKKSLEHFLGVDRSSELTERELEDVNQAIVQHAGGTDRYGDIKSIDDILVLPSEFDQAEALYVVARRANKDTLKKLIVQANNISDSSDRQGALFILFLKLADSDPELAIEMSQLPVFSGNVNLSSNVWRAWARRDLDAALSAAQKIKSNSEKNKIAQTLFLAVGIIGNDASHKIESALGIKPGQWAQWQYTLGLAQNSPTKAVSYAANLSSTKTRDFLAKRLGHYLGQNKIEQAVDLAEYFRSTNSKNEYLQALNNSIAMANPEQAIRNWLDQSTSGLLNRSESKELNRAFRELADSDLDTALSIWSEVDSHKQKLELASVLVLTMAQQEISSAINWAFDLDQQLGINVAPHEKILNRSIRQLAKIDAIQTMNSVLSLPQGEASQSLLLSIINQVAEVDPNSAIQAISTLSDKPSRMKANDQLLSGWMNLDPAAALNYISNNISVFENQTLVRVSYKLQKLAPETAIGYISKIPSDIADKWLLSIARSASNTKTHEEFEAFINQYQHLDPNEVMKASLVRRLSRTNFVAAEALVSEMRSSEQKDLAINSIIQKKVLNDPQGAISLWDSIENESTKTASLPRLVYGWDKNDRNGLRDWISKLPEGEQKDTAIFASAYSNTDITEADIAMINNISEESSRQQTVSKALIRMAYNDLDTAARLAQEAKLNPVLQSRLLENLQNCFGPTINDSNRPRHCLSQYDDH